MSDVREAMLLKAAADVLQERLAKANPPVVNVTVESAALADAIAKMPTAAVQVQVDTGPIAEAVAVALAPLAEAMATMQGQIADLTAAIANRPKRRLVITHGEDVSEIREA